MDLLCLIPYIGSQNSSDCHQSPCFFVIHPRFFLGRSNFRSKTAKSLAKTSQRSVDARDAGGGVWTQDWVAPDDWLCSGYTLKDLRSADGAAERRSDASEIEIGRKTEMERKFHLKPLVFLPFST